MPIQSFSMLFITIIVLKTFPTNCLAYCSSFCLHYIPIHHLYESFIRFICFTFIIFHISHQLGINIKL